MHRRSALSLLVALAIGLLTITPPALAGPVVHAPEPRPIDDSCPPHQVPEDGFADVPEDGAHEPAVDCVVHWEIANGLTPTSYGPDRIVTRAQMASFLARLLDVTHGHLPATDVDHFSDDDASTHARSIDRLAAVGIVGGRGNGRYEPDAGVTRAQMAAFLTRAFDYHARQRGAEPLATGQDAFRDDDGNALEPAIDAAAAAGFTGGYADGSFRPAGLVRRDQMASFLARVLDLAVEQGMATPPGEEEPQAPEEPEPTASAEPTASPQPTASPEPSASPEPTASPQPTEPTSPGNSRNCGDFDSWSAAQAWFEEHHPSYGDVANLDPDGDLVACDHLHDAPGSVYQALRVPRVVDIVQVYWTQPDQRTLSSIADRVTEVDAHLAELTDGTVGLTVGRTTGWVQIPAPADYCDLRAIETGAQQAAQFSPEEGRHLIAYFPEYEACSSAGYAQQPGHQVWLNGAADIGVVLHELLHNIGMRHANSVACFDSTGRSVKETADSRCEVRDGGDPYDVMGHSHALVGADNVGTFGLANLLDLGVVDQADVPEVPVRAGEQVFTLNRSTFGEGLRGLRITQDQRRYLVEYRAERAGGALQAGDGEGGVLVRRDAPPETVWAAGLALMDMQPYQDSGGSRVGDYALRSGDWWRAPDGAFSIRTVSVTEDTATVHVLVRATG